MTAREALALAAERLRIAGVEDAAREARLLLEHSLGLTRAHLLTRPLLEIQPESLAAYDALVARRALREPIPYVLGHCHFRRLDLLVDARALIPRPETELLVERALDLTPCPSFTAFRTDSSLKGRGNEVLPPPLGEGWGEGSAVDVGTGSGAIAISLAVECPTLKVYATDASPDALALARENAARHGVADRVTFLLGDLLEPLPEPVDLIVANLPYVATRDLTAQPELGWEPRLALDGGPDGLDAYRRLLERAPTHLRPGGCLHFEVGAEQGEAALALVRRAFPDAAVRVHRDYAGHDRVVEVKT